MAFVLLITLLEVPAAAAAPPQTAVDSAAAMARRLVKHSESELALAEFRLLPDAEKRDILDALRAFLGSADSCDDSYALAAFGAAGPVGVDYLPDVLKGALSECQNTREAAKDAVRSWGAAAMPRLSGALGARDDEQRAGAYVVLSGFGPSGAPFVPLLSARAKDAPRDPSEAFGAALALTGLGATGEAKLLTLYHSTEPAVRRTVVKAAASMRGAGGPAAVLAGALQDADVGIQEAALQGLQFVGRRAAYTAPILARRAQAGEPAAMQALAHVDPDRAVRILADQILRGGDARTPALGALRTVAANDFEPSPPSVDGSLTLLARGPEAAHSAALDIATRAERLPERAARVFSDYLLRASTATPPRERRFEKILYRLERMGTQAAPALPGLLAVAKTAREQAVREAAASLAARLAPESLQEACLVDFADPAPGVRLRALRCAFSREACPAKVPPLLYEALRDPDLGVRWEALKALNRPCALSSRAFGSYSYSEMAVDWSRAWPPVADALDPAGQMAVSSAALGGRPTYESWASETLRRLASLSVERASAVSAALRASEAGSETVRAAAIAALAELNDEPATRAAVFRGLRGGATERAASVSAAAGLEDGESLLLQAYRSGPLPERRAFLAGARSTAEKVLSYPTRLSPKQRRLLGIVEAFAREAVREPDAELAEAAGSTLRRLAARDAASANRIMGDSEARIRAAGAAGMAERGSRSPRVRDALFAALRHPDWRVRLSACEALSAMGTAARGAGAEISRVLDDVSLWDRAGEPEGPGGGSGSATEPRLLAVAALEALAVIGPEARSASAAVLLLRGHADPRLRAAVARALAGLGLRSVAVLAALRQLALDPEPSVRAAALAALGSLAPVEALALALESEARASASEAERASAFRIVAEAVPDRADLRRPFLGALGRLNLMKAINGLGNDCAVDALRLIARDGPEQARRYALMALGGCGAAEPEVIATVAAALKDEARGVRQEAVRQLERLGPAAQAAVPGLLKALRSELEALKSVPESAWDVRGTVPEFVSALQRIAGVPPGAVPLLMEAREAVWRRRADDVLWDPYVDILKEVGEREPEAVLELLKDGRPAVRRAAVMSLPLHRLAPERYLPLLESLVAEPDEELRGLGLWNLRRAGLPGSQTAPILRRALKGKSGAERAAFLREVTANRLPVRELLPEIEHCLKEGDGPLRLAAIEALEVFERDQEVAAALLTPLVSEVSPHAVRARAALTALGFPDAAEVRRLERSLENEGQRWNAFQTLMWAGPRAAAAAPTLGRLLDSPDSSVSAYAARALHHVDPEAFAREAIPRVDRGLRSDDPQARSAALYAVQVETGAYVSLVPALETLVGRGGGERRLAGAVFLAEIDPPRALALATTALFAELADPAEAARTARILLALGAPAPQVVSRLLAHDDETTAFVDFAGGELDLPRPQRAAVTKALVGRLQTASAEERVQAARALGRLRPLPGEAVAALRAASRRGDAELRDEAVRALKAGTAP